MAFKMPKMPKMPKLPKMGGMAGGMAVGLGGTGLLLASQLGTEAIRAGAAVGGAAIGADVLKDLFNHPEAMLAIGAVAVIFLLK